MSRTSLPLSINPSSAYSACHALAHAPAHTQDPGKHNERLQRSSPHTGHRSPANALKLTTLLLTSLFVIDTPNIITSRLDDLGSIAQNMFYNVEMLVVVLMITNGPLTMVATSVAIDATVGMPPSFDGPVTAKLLSEPSYLSEEREITPKIPSPENEVPDSKCGDKAAKPIDEDVKKVEQKKCYCEPDLLLDIYVIGTMVLLIVYGILLYIVNVKLGKHSKHRETEKGQLISGEKAEDKLTPYSQFAPPAYVDVEPSTTPAKKQEV